MRSWFCLTGSPSVGVHLHQTDEEMAEQGFGMADIVCHVCALAWSVSYPNYDRPEDAPLGGILDTFMATHRHDPAPCREPMTVERYFDFREVAYA